MTHPSELKQIIQNLSKEQKEHYKSISWLTNPMGPRGSGRSYLLALSFIEHSLLCRKWVRVINHGDYPYADKEMLVLIKKIMEPLLKELHFQVKRTRGGTEIKVSRKCEKYTTTTWDKVKPRK